MNETEKEKLLNLLADQTLFGLDEIETAELERLRASFPEYARDDSFERAAAAFALSNLEIEESMPANLQAKISASANDFFAASETRDAPANFAAQSKALVADEPRRAIVETDAKLPWWSWLGWGVAALASIALAVNLWTTRSQQPVIAQNPPVVQPSPVIAPPTAAPQLSLAEQRTQLLASAGDVAQAEWTEANPKTQNDISGDIVWSNSLQKGFMRFRGLPVNDPNRETYQLWIADEAQNEKTPIDGGVFDVLETGEVIVPIDAKLKVKKPKAFNLTMERPGGVVVSKLDKVVAVAKI